MYLYEYVCQEVQRSDHESYRSSKLHAVQRRLVKATSNLRTRGIRSCTSREIADAAGCVRFKRSCTLPVSLSLLHPTEYNWGNGLTGLIRALQVADASAQGLLVAGPSHRSLPGIASYAFGHRQCRGEISTLFMHSTWKHQMTLPVWIRISFDASRHAIECGGSTTCPIYLPGMCTSAASTRTLVIGTHALARFVAMIPFPVASSVMRLESSPSAGLLRSLHPFRSACIQAKRGRTAPPFPHPIPTHPSGSGCFCGRCVRATRYIRRWNTVVQQHVEIVQRSAQDQVLVLGSVAHSFDQAMERRELGQTDAIRCAGLQRSNVQKQGSNLFLQRSAGEIVGSGFVLLGASDGWRFIGTRWEPASNTVGRQRCHR